MTKKKTKKINIALSPKILKKLNDGNYNKNKLLVNLFEKFLSKKEKNTGQ